MAKAGKKYQEACKLVEAGKLYTAAEAMDLVKKTATAKFDESIELHVRLGVIRNIRTSRSAVPSFFRTAPAKRSASSSLQRARRSRRRRLLAQTSSVPTKSCRRFRGAGSTSMSRSLRLT